MDKKTSRDNNQREVKMVEKLGDTINKHFNIVEIKKYHNTNTIFFILKKRVGE